MKPPELFAAHYQRFKLNLIRRAHNALYELGLRNAVKYSKTYPGADCASDHNPVVCKLVIKLRKLKRTQKSF